MTFAAPALPATRYAGLDGLRAVAVALVVIYHLFSPSVLPGGFIGVDVFFVISGFLITSLLLREHSATGGIRLGAFWKRRARRLLPALALVVTVCSSVAWFTGGDVLFRLGEQVIGAFTFSYNWLSIVGDTGYFGSTAPELFRNFWSLAVEEQFYVLWPLLLPLFLLIPRTWGRAGAVLLLAAASAGWMAAVTATGAITRGYFGTDTHAFGILLGVALAFALFPLLAKDRPPFRPIALDGGWKIVSPRPSRAPRARTITTVVGSVALAGLLVVALLPPTTTAVTFPGALLAAGLLTVAAIAAAVWPGSVFGPALDRRVLRWVGDRSYGIYLWHWPLLVLVVALVEKTGPEAGFSPWLGAFVLVLTLLIAETSYRVVESPVRRLGFRGALTAFASRFRGSPVRRLGAATAAVTALLIVGGTSAAVSADPPMASGEAAVAAGIQALENTPTPAPSAPAASPSPSASAPDAVQPALGPAMTEPKPTLVQIAFSGDQITAIGDSVMLASAPALLERLPGIAIDAAVSRSSWAGPGILESQASGGALRPYIVVALGTNGSIDAGSLTRMLEIAGPRRLVVLVNAYAPRDWIAGVNTDLAGFADAHANVVVADWSGAISARTDLLAGDQVHPEAEGGRVFADVVNSTIEQALDERSRQRYEAQMRRYEHFGPGARSRD